MYVVTHALCVLAYVRAIPCAFGCECSDSPANAVVLDIAQDNGGQSPFGAVFFTNRPHIYGQQGEPDPSKHYFAVWAASSPVPEAIINALGEAASQYGNVPSKFPSDFPQEQVDDPTNKDT